MNEGTVVQVIGPSVDIRFEPEKLPKLLDAVKIEHPERKINLTLEVAQHVGDNVDRVVEKANIKLEKEYLLMQHLKEVGNYEVTVRLGEGMEETVKVAVQAAK